MFRILVQGEKLLAGAKEELQREEAVVVVRMGGDQFLRVANDAAHGEALAGFGCPLPGGLQFLVESGDGFPGDGRRSILGMDARGGGQQQDGQAQDAG